MPGAGAEGRRGSGSGRGGWGLGGGGRERGGGAERVPENQRDVAKPVAEGSWEGNG